MGMNIEAWATELDQLLAEWRTIRQLDPQTAEQIYQTILTTAEQGMSAEWWEQYKLYLTAVIQQAKEFSANVQFNFAYQPGAITNRCVDKTRFDPGPQWQPYLKFA